MSEQPEVKWEFGGDAPSARENEAVGAGLLPACGCGCSSGAGAGAGSGSRVPTDLPM